MIVLFSTILCHVFLAVQSVFRKKQRDTENVWKGGINKSSRGCILLITYASAFYEIDAEASVMIDHPEPDKSLVQVERARAEAPLMEQAV